MRFVTSGLNHTNGHLDNAIGHDDTLFNLVACLATFIARLRAHKLHTRIYLEPIGLTSSVMSYPQTVKNSPPLCLLCDGFKTDSAHFLRYIYIYIYIYILFFAGPTCSCGCLKKNQSAPRPSEHPPVMGGKMSKSLGGIKGCKYKTSSWHLNRFPDADNIIGSTV